MHYQYVVAIKFFLFFMFLVPDFAQADTLSIIHCNIIEYEYKGKIRPEPSDELFYIISEDSITYIKDEVLNLIYPCKIDEMRIFGEYKKNPIRIVVNINRFSGRIVKTAYYMDDITETETFYGECRGAKKKF